MTIYVAKDCLCLYHLKYLLSQNNTRRGEPVVYLSLSPTEIKLANSDMYVTNMNIFI